MTDPTQAPGPAATAAPDPFTDSALALCLARAAEAAAFAARAHVGRGDEEAADLAAAAGMARALGNIEVDGTVVLGGGEEGDIPALFTGQRVGTGRGPAVDIALDALEGRTLAAKAMQNAISVIAMAPRGTLMAVPDLYMDKLAVGPGYPRGVVTLDMPPAERIARLAAARGVAPSEITACVLDRPRHAPLIAELREAGARVRLISDGDVAGVIHVAEAARTGIDIYMGLGGAREGVLGAAALKCLGGQMQARLVADGADDRARLARAGIERPERVLEIDDMVQDQVILAATAITDGMLLRGLRVEGDRLVAETLLMRSRTGTVRHMICRKRLDGAAPGAADGTDPGA